MLKYFLKRIVSSLITIFMIITITFFLMKAIPGHPFTDEKMPNPEIRAAMMEKYGLDKPLLSQYWLYLKNFIRGDFGVSYTRAGITVNKVIADGFPYSLAIGLYSSLIVVFAGIVFGVICEEWGLVIGIAVLLSFAGIALFAVRAAKTAGSTFYAIAAVAAAGMLLFQLSLNVFGITDILPLTGVTLPFVSRGGSSMLCSWGLLAYIRAAGAPFEPPKPDIAISKVKRKAPARAKEGAV